MWRNFALGGRTASASRLLKALLNRIVTKRMSARLLNMRSGKATLEDADRSDTGLERINVGIEPLRH